MARPVAKSLEQVEQAAQPKTGERNAPKELFVERATDGLYWIRLTAGGEVPDALKGKWTSAVKAEAAIANYVTTKEQVAAQPSLFAAA